MPQPRFALHPFSFAFALALGSLAAQAQAQATTDGQPQQKTLATVTVEASADASAEGLSKPFAGGQVARGSRIGILGTQDFMDTPFSFTSYTHDLIQDQSARSIGDVLLNDASVRSTRGFGNYQQAYFIRGFIVYSDDVAYNGLYGLVPRQYMATELVERVDVLRGANTFLSGAGGGSVASSGIGGMINVLPKRAPNEPLTQFTVGTQSGGEAYVAADIARRFGPDQAAGIRLNLAHRNGEGAVDGEKNRTDALGLGLDWHSRNVRLSADIGYQKNDQDRPRASVFPAFGSSFAIPSAPDASSNFTQPWAYSNSRDVFATARGEVDLTDNITAWGAIGTRHSNERNALDFITLNDSAGNTGEFRFDNARRDRVTTGEAGLRGKFRTGAVSHNVVVSYSALDNASRNAFATGGFWNSNLYNPTFVPAPAVAGAGSLTDPLVTERIKSQSLAVADTFGFLDDRLLLTVGARHQTIEDYSYDFTTGVQNGQYDRSKTLPVAGLVYKASPQVSVYANYAEALTKGESAPVGVVNVGTTLAPALTKQQEVGVKWDAGSIGATAALFSIKKPTGGVNAANFFGEFGEQRNRGLELSLFGEPTKGLRLLGGATFLDSKMHTPGTAASEGKEAIGVPELLLNVGADWDVPGVRGLSLNARVLYTGKQYVNSANTQSIPSWTRTDVGAKYLMEVGGKVVTLRARVENLFDKNYWTSTGGYPGQGYLVVGAPRTFVLTGSLDF